MKYAPLDIFNNDKYIYELAFINGKDECINIVFNVPTRVDKPTLIVGGM